MKKSFLFLSLFCLSAIVILFDSCQKEVLPSNNLNSNKTLIEKVDTWLDSQKSSKQPNKAANIDLLKENLDIASARIENLDNKHDFLIIPIKDEVVNKKNLNKNSTLTLLLVTDKLGKISSGSIVYFQPSDGEKHKFLPENTLSNLVNRKKVTVNGTYKMLTVTGKWISQFETKNGKLFSAGAVQKKNKTTEDSPILNATTCTDWYLETTYYYEDGHTEITDEYLGTTCDLGCDDGEYQSFCTDIDGSGGGSGGGDMSGEDEASSTSESITPPDQDTGGPSNGYPLYFNFGAFCAWDYSFSEGRFVFIRQYKPYPIPGSQFFTDKNGNTATFLLNVIDPWTTTKTPLTPTTVLVSWDFDYTQTFVYTTGTLGPFTFFDGIMKVIGP